MTLLEKLNRGIAEGDLLRMDALLTESSKELSVISVEAATGLIQRALLTKRQEIAVMLGKSTLSIDKSAALSMAVSANCGELVEVLAAPGLITPKLALQAIKSGNSRVTWLVLDTAPKELLNGKLITEAIKAGNLLAAAMLVSFGHDPRAEGCYYLKYALTAKQPGLAEYLAGFPGDREDMSEALVLAAGAGYTDVVVKLIPHADVSYKDSAALRRSIKHGISQLVKALLAGSDVSAREYEALQTAIQTGHLEITNMLLNKVDKDADLTKLYRMAVLGPSEEIICLLKPFARTDGLEELVERSRHQQRAVAHISRISKTLLD